MLIRMFNPRPPKCFGSRYIVSAIDIYVHLMSLKFCFDEKYVLSSLGCCRVLEIYYLEFMNGEKVFMCILCAEVTPSFLKTSLY